ncbi:chromosome replication initiation / membrane attachment protein DnaB [Listeria floridensis FSL S10-1187]|uniref:Chromosome replication initiation / membrane attachment protein DnaB n=1 Tax=Listeria floridensis FSL S10-1187 TaxID=1265817 RepID=A0ABN0RHB5_9LIST|nr:chromosome replication initiation / membrane attachment protein DnaB [Listeria floridensis FSL S10-1187]
MRTFQKSGSDAQYFVYQLLAPLNPKQFFQDGLLNIYLFSQVGNRRYQLLQQMFSDNSFDSTGYSELTRSFQDVFAPFRGGMETPRIEEQSEYVEPKPQAPIKLDAIDFDWTYFYNLLSPNMLSRNQITEEVADTILKMHAIYQIDEAEMPSFFVPCS